MWLVRRSRLRRFGLLWRLSRKPTTTTRSSAFAWDWRVDGSWAICCPVSVGGDQGRDAESHWTDLPSDDSTSWFAVLASTDSVVLACTIQKRDVAGKIRRDLSTITATGTQVNRVIYFTVTAVPIAQRHELQMDARATHGIELDIWDAQAIAQNLADHDLFTWPSIICTLQLTSPPSLPSPNQNYRMIGDGRVPNRLQAPGGS